MTTFECIACKATIEFEGSATQTCRFCGAKLLVPADVFRQTPSATASAIDEQPPPSSGMDFVQQARLAAEIKKKLVENKKIEAVKIFREATGSSLRESREVIKSLQADDAKYFREMTGPSRPMPRPGGTTSLVPILIVFVLAVMGAVIFFLTF